jgi:hypothetical protein
VKSSTISTVYKSEEDPTTTKAKVPIGVAGTVSCPLLGNLHGTSGGEIALLA